MSRFYYLIWKINKIWGQSICLATNKSPILLLLVSQLYKIHPLEYIELLPLRIYWSDGYIRVTRNPRITNTCISKEWWKWKINFPLLCEHQGDFHQFMYVCLHIFPCWFIVWRGKCWTSSKHREEFIKYMFVHNINYIYIWAHELCRHNFMK